VSILAIIPARSGSVSIPHKNLRPLPDGSSCLGRAVAVANEVCDLVYVSTDYTVPELWAAGVSCGNVLRRPAELCGPDVPMIDVVRHAMSGMQNTLFAAPDTIVVLLQPTQPLRKPEHVREAIRLLQETPKASSVMSVVQLPAAHHPEFVVAIADGEIEHWTNCCECPAHSPLVFPPRRQAVAPAYIRDGTVYAFYRRTVEREGNIYGTRVLPLIIPPEETCELDTPEDWARLEARVTHASGR
jgi:CMP-N,N'-diacetyllegionaminic acid synthase